MTTTETIPTATATDTWADEFAALKARHPHVREPILAALNILLAEPSITDDDAKARAAMRGVRITAASINGARNLLARRETAVPTEPMVAPATAPEQGRSARHHIVHDRDARRGWDQDIDAAERRFVLIGTWSIDPLATPGSSARWPTSGTPWRGRRSRRS